MSQVHQAIDRLPRENREVLILRDLEGLTGEAAAARLGISISALKSRLFRARSAVRDHVEHLRTTVSSLCASAQRSVRSTLAPETADRVTHLPPGVGHSGAQRGIGRVTVLLSVATALEPAVEVDGLLATGALEAIAAALTQPGRHARRGPSGD